jgi:uncharacterized membrane protein
MFAFIATGVIATIGLGIDVIAWYRTYRALQNAADAAAVAAARNATSSYQSEAGAVNKSSNGASCSVSWWTTSRSTVRGRSSRLEVVLLQA